MSRAMEIPVSDGLSVLFEVTPSVDVGPAPAHDTLGNVQGARSGGGFTDMPDASAPNLAQTAVKLRDQVDEALRRLSPALDTVRTRLAASAPTEVTVEFGLTLESSATIMVAGGKAGAHFTVSMTWKPPAP